MAHLGGAYCQTVSARIKSKEAMASFPLSQRPFARLELSEQERRRFHTQATELLGHALSEYEEFALIRHRQVDRRRWKPVKSHEKLAVYRESRSYAISRSLSVEDEESFARAAVLAPAPSRSSSSSGGSRSGSVSTIHELPAHQVSELELLTGWGPTATEAREQKKRAKSRSVSASGNLEQLPVLLGVGNIVGSLDDVMYGVAAPDCAAMALKNGYAHGDVLDGDVLCAIEGPSQRSPFRFLGIKWLVKSTAGGSIKHRLAAPRDLVYLEATGVITRGDGVRIGYQIMQSVKLRGCPDLYDSHGVVRARCESVHLFVELDSRTVDVFLKSNVTPNGKISESAALQSCANNLLYCGKTVLCSQDKKLAWQLECRGDNQRPHKDEGKDKATQCSVCSKTFGRFLRQSIQCKLCSMAMCSKCCVERTIKHVDTSGNKRHTSKFVSTSVVELCMTCIATNMQTSALMIAREELMSGRFGRVAKGSALPPSQNRGSGNSGEYSSSIATITIEDIPGQPEHHARPPRQSDGISRKNQRPHQREESRRGHRDQGRYRDEPETDGPETATRRGHAYRESPPLSSRKYAHRDLPKLRTRSDAPRPVFRRGDSDERHRSEDYGAGRYTERQPPRDPILRSRHHPVYGTSPVEPDNSERGLPVDLCDLDDSSPYRSSKESIRKTTSSSGSSLEEINAAGVSRLRLTDNESDSEEEDDDDAESCDTFDSFGDLIEIRSEIDDVDETLDTKDMEAVKRASQVNRKLWEQIADLRDAAENVYLYTKESTAMNMTQGGSIRRRPSNPVRPGY
ncbi:FYVE-FINGER-CONTAINING RAB5 EFFECTOR PROTEIN RABENOSYN-5-RELATED [Phytophthora cinnamomi]|uniref:FYVE-FINGER-CONTAINING RAB5 EFFECTOR PROTEIN RABENOSYN-5-RELATED n=1 Tax=Phytophthora cinnamomi TaxID=4785 RepID=UPI0035594096|nr:FYVE-FINGER-CONTAINING RAB5 EFFECTOR PROTEIN RABENOSYN-5-RELATED [Phytophthora cinnamomi]